MVKLQKPIPKKLGNKPQLDNPIKKKKLEVKKVKTSSTVTQAKVSLLSSPIKEAKSTKKVEKDAPKAKKNVKKIKVPENGESKLVAPLNPEKTIEKLVKPKADKTEKKKKNKEVIVKIAKQEGAIKPVAAEKPAVKILAPVKAGESSKILAKSIPSAKSAPQLKPTTVKSVPLVKAPVPVKDAAPAQKKIILPPPVEKISAPVPTKGPIAPPKSPKGKKKKNKKNAVAVAEPTPVTKKPKVAKKAIRLQEKKKAKIAYRLAKQEKKDKKEKKERPGDSVTYDPTPYDEEKFNAIVNVENIKKIAEALKTQVEKEVSSKKSSIFEDYRYFLQVGSFKIANCPKRMVKLNLKHSLVDRENDILLVVPDLQRGAKVDYEPTIHHYEDLLRFHGVEGIKIMPMNQLRKEFGTYEQKRRLCATYDHFLCDGRIVSHVVGIIGKIAQKPRSTFHAVRLHEEKDIKAEIEKALRKTAYRQLAKSSLHAIPVGSHKFTAQQLAENVQLVVTQLKKLFPGGLSNIRNLYLKIDITGTSSLPLYVSMAQAPEQTPLVVGPREQRMIKLKREANEVLSKFAMTKEGKLIKLTKPEVEKKRKLQEMRAALKEDEEEAKKVKKVKKEKAPAEDEKKEDEVKELELPENEDDDDDDDGSSADEEDDVVQLGGSSDDDDDDMDQLDEDEGEIIGFEILENGIADENEEQSDEEDQQEVDESDGDDDEDDDEGDEEDEDGDDDEDEEAEESN